MMYEYECAMTGLTREGGADDDSDSLGDLPVGWTRVQMTRRAYNPRWVMIQQVKEAMVANLLQQVPPEMQQVQSYVVSLQVDAQFHALESETPMYLPDIDDVVYLSNEGAIVESINELRDMLGLEALVLEEDDEEEAEEQTLVLGDSSDDGDEDEDEDEEA